MHVFPGRSDESFKLWVWKLQGCEIIWTAERIVTKKETASYSVTSLQLQLELLALWQRIHSGRWETRLPLHRYLIWSRERHGSYRSVFGRCICFAFSQSRRWWPTTVKWKRVVLCASLGCSRIILISAGECGDCLSEKPLNTTGCDIPAVEACVCAADAWCCQVHCDAVCALIVHDQCGSQCSCKWEIVNLTRRYKICVSSSICRDDFCFFLILYAPRKLKPQEIEIMDEKYRPINTRLISQARTFSPSSFLKRLSYAAVTCCLQI